MKIQLNFLNLSGVARSYESGPKRYDAKAYDPQNFSVRVGSSYSDKGGDKYDISHIFVKGADRRNDIGMMRTKTKMEMFKTAPVAYKMPESVDYVAGGRNGFTQGYGQNPNDRNTLHLYRTDLTTMSHDECKMYYTNLEDTMMCAMGEDDATPCQVSLICTFIN